MQRPPGVFAYAAAVGLWALDAWVSWHRKSPVAAASFGAVAVFAFGRLLHEVRGRRAISPPIRAIAVHGHVKDPQVLYDYAQSRLQAQLDAIDAIDAKLGIIFSVSSAEIGALAAFLALRQPPAGAEALIISISFAAYLVLGGVSARGLWSRQLDIGPEPNDLIECFDDKDPRLVRTHLAEKLFNAYVANDPARRDKFDGLRIVIVALIVQTLGLLGGVTLVAAQP